MIQAVSEDDFLIELAETCSRPSVKKCWQGPGRGACLDIILIWLVCEVYGYPAGMNCELKMLSSSA